jgi:hypothetical protein
LFLEHLNNFTTNCIFAGSFDAAMRIAWRAIVSEIPHSSKSIIPGRTLATQYSRLPFPDPIRVSAGRFVMLYPEKFGSRVYQYAERTESKHVDWIQFVEK